MIRSVPQIVTVKNVCQSVTVQATRNVTMLSAAHPLQKVFFFNLSLNVVHAVTFSIRNVTCTIL